MSSSAIVGNTYLFRGHRRMCVVTRVSWRFVHVLRYDRRSQGVGWTFVASEKYSHAQWRSQWSSMLSRVLFTGNTYRQID
jgi:hypothetical protein